MFNIRYMYLTLQLQRHVGVRILDGAVVDKLEARAIEFERDYIDIYSASWGPRDDGKTMEGPNSLTEKALKDGTELVRAREATDIIY